ncbi:hypothetical protein U9M48_013850 [Paspalum notatum var. saurae]|uniref:Uncharacterized protein n=1 Tax=Paspalum notatum var. saurae TaxID=547442 RepID=A0AAQ3T1A2_PASNO
MPLLAAAQTTQPRQCSAPACTARHATPRHAHLRRCLILLFDHNPSVTSASRAPYLPRICQRRGGQRCGSNGYMRSHHQIQVNCVLKIQTISMVPPRTCSTTPSSLYQIHIPAILICLFHLCSFFTTLCTPVLSTYGRMVAFFITAYGEKQYKVVLEKN